MRRILIMFTCTFLLISTFSATPAQAAVAASTIYNGSYPTVITEDAAGNVYIAEDHDADPTKLGIVVIPAITGTLYGQSVIAGTALRLVSVANPSGIAISPTGTLMWSLPNGNIYALASTSRTVFGVSVAANTVTTIMTGTALTNGLDFDSSGNLFGIGQTPGSISVIPVASATLYGYSLTANIPETLLAPDNSHWFWDLAIDSSGNIFVADGWGDADIGQGIFVFPRTSGTLYGELSLPAGFLSRMTTFGSARYSGIDIDDSDVIFTNPYGGPTKVLSPADTSLFDTSVTSNIAVSLTATSGYAFTGMLVTSSGALVLGGYSATYKLVHTPLYVPGIPGIGTATATSPTSASIAFTAPTSDGGATIQTYTATSTPGSLTGTISQAGSGSITINGLTSSTPYTFTVTATNSVGTSSASSASVSITTPASQAELVAAALAAQRAAEAKREADKQFARSLIIKNYVDLVNPRFDLFATAEISGVTVNNLPYINNEILALAPAPRSEIINIIKISNKYRILDAICVSDRFNTIYTNDLINVGLIPKEYKAGITYSLRMLPIVDRNEYLKIYAAINNQIALNKIRNERLLRNRLKYR